MASSSSASSFRSWKYDVFLSFRGEDTRKTFVDHLYYALERKLIQTYKDDITLPRGESVGPALLKAIEESRHAVIIFSKNYPNSSWCLDELVHIMRCRAENGQIVMPIFYDVDPSDVRKQKGEFGEAFAKQEAENVMKAESWRKSLVDASNISGWEPKNVSNGHEAAVIQKIVDAISDNLLSPNSDIDEDEKFVGMKARVQDLISRLEIGTGGVRMVGIWGVGGGGKTTLATSVYMKINHHFQGHCIKVDNIREESSKSGLKKLQEDILKGLLKIEGSVQNVEQIIRSRLRNSKVLILLDDVDDPEQLEALAGSHSWFGAGSRIIITTRNEHLLQKVDYVSSVRLLSQDEGNQLFKKYAYNDKKPLKDYGILSLHVVSYAAGLPLALRVLGSFLYDKDEKEWKSTLDRLKEIPEGEIVEKLKISYDGLKKVEKELFLDIACFFRRSSRNDAVEILDACGFHSDIGIKVLIQKSLITITDDDSFDMHDLIQEMGHYIVRGEHPNNPGKHSRVWKREDINKMCLGDTKMENDKTQVIHCYNIDNPLHFSKMLSNMKKIRWLIVKGSSSEAPDFLSNELRYIDWANYPGSRFPDSFQPTNLAVLKMIFGLQKELWKGWKHLPHLKELRLSFMKELVSTPDFDGLPSLQILELFHCHKLKKIHPSLGNHESLKYISVDCFNLKKFPRIDHMKKLETLRVSSYHLNFEIPEIQSDMINLGNLSLSGFKMQVFLSSVVVHCPNLISLEANDDDTLARFASSVLTNSVISFSFTLLTNSLRKLDLSHSGSNHISKLDFKLSQFTVLVHLELSNCNWLKSLPELPPSIVVFLANGCHRLTDIGDSIRNCKWLCQVSLKGGSILNDGDRLLQFMLQGKAIENHSMFLQLEGLQIPREFRPRLRAGNRCTVQLPENWSNDFCGFLMCAVINNKPQFRHTATWLLIPKMAMTQVRGGSMVIDSQDDVVWEESGDDIITWVGYVSFGSFRHTATWLDETCKTVSFRISIKSTFVNGELCSGFGVILVPRISESGPTDTSPPEYYSEDRKKKYDFKPEFWFKDDLTCYFNIPSIIYSP